MFAMYFLTLSFPGTYLVPILAVAICISPNNGPIETIPSGKLVVDVLAIHCILLIMKIRPVLVRV